MMRLFHTTQQAPGLLVAQGLVVLTLHCLFIHSYFDDFIVIPRKENEPFDTFTVPNVSLTLLLTALPSIYGYWRVRRRIVGAYMGYLLNRTTDTIRGEIFDLAFEEVAKQQSGAIPRSLVNSGTPNPGKDDRP